MDHSKYNEALVDIDKFLRESFDVSKEINLIYQYTDLTAFEGIVGNKKIWATHYRYLNDEKEFVLGLNHAKEYLKNKLIKYQSEGANAFIQVIMGAFSHMDSKDHFPFESADLYMISFSLNKDRLSQWRGYGKQYDSVCIGFLLRNIVCDKNDVDCPYMLRKVIYDENEQKELMGKFLEKVLNLFEENEEYISETEGVSGILFPWLLTRFIQLCLCFKESVWQEEEEVRIIATPNVYNIQNDSEEKIPIDFRKGDGTLTPYIKLPIFRNDSIDAVSEAVLPKSEKFLLCKKSLKMFWDRVCQDNKVSFDLNVVESGISIRY